MAVKQISDNCDCCSGVDIDTPARIDNRPAQTSIRYRIGTHSQFKASMLSRLSSVDLPAMQALSVRSDDDFTIAYMDAVASTLDVISFYQERFANEHCLRTAVQKRSVQEMAQLIGYQPAPGVAASTHLAFTLQDTPGDSTNTEPVDIPIGTRVQSVPGQDEQAQVFETLEPVQARVQWNSVNTQTTTPAPPSPGDTDIYIQGVSNSVSAGDTIAFIDRERFDDANSNRWDIRTVSAVQTDPDNLRTRLLWDVPLSNIAKPKAASPHNTRLYVFRHRAALFGHNAPDPQFMIRNNKELKILLSSYLNNKGWWENYKIQNNQIDISPPLKDVLPGSWVALKSSDIKPGIQLYRVDRVAELSRADYGLTASITRVVPEHTKYLTAFGLQDTLVLAGSEALDIAPRPLNYPVYGDTLVLDRLYKDLMPGRKLAISGIAQKIKIAAGVSGLKLNFDNEVVLLKEGDSLSLAAAPEKLNKKTAAVLLPWEFAEALDQGTQPLRLTVQDQLGRNATLQVKANQIVLDNSPAEVDPPRFSQVMAIASSNDAVRHKNGHTIIDLADMLNTVYQRISVSINFNVAMAGHGETVTEILGDGDTRKSNQRFTLKQSPLTFVSADTPTGTESSLKVTVNDITWQQQSSLFRRAGEERVYQLVNSDQGPSSIIFGDGVEGALLPTGQTNVRASYRKGIGIAGNINAGKLSTLLTRPLGVAEVTNPEPAAGGEDPESLEQAKTNAPVTVLTLDRAVSVEDYENYARAFAGVSKAHALWIASGPARGIFITVAGIDGADIAKNSATYSNLVQALRRYGDPMIPLTVENYRAANFSLNLSINVAAQADKNSVLADVEAALRANFSFANRQFGQHVSRDEIVAVAHSVDAVQAVRVTRFAKQPQYYRQAIATVITADLPLASLTDLPKAAEVLTLSPEPISMELFA